MRLANSKAQATLETVVEAELDEFLKDLDLQLSDPDEDADRLKMLKTFAQDSVKEKDMLEQNKQLQAQIAAMKSSQLSDESLSLLQEEVTDFNLSSLLNAPESSLLQDLFDSIPFLPPAPQPFSFSDLAEYYEPSDGLSGKRQRQSLLDNTLTDLVINLRGHTSVFRSGLLTALLKYERFPPGLYSWIIQEAFVSFDRPTRESALKLLLLPEAKHLISDNLLVELLKAISYDQVKPLFQILRNQIVHTLFEQPEFEPWWVFCVEACVMPALLDHHLRSIFPLLQECLLELVEGIPEPQWDAVRWMGVVFACIERVPQAESLTHLHRMHLIRSMPSSTPRTRQLQSMMIFVQIHKLFGQPVPQMACPFVPELGPINALLDFVHKNLLRNRELQHRADWKLLFCFFSFLDCSINKQSLPKGQGYQHEQTDRLREMLQRLNCVIFDDNSDCTPTLCKDILNNLISRIKLFFGDRRPTFLSSTIPTNVDSSLLTATIQPSITDFFPKPTCSSK